MVSLKRVEKPNLVGQKKRGESETGVELKTKLKQVSEETHIKKAFQVEKKTVME